ncbi:MAG: dihydropteroate synthase [Holosporaceae bacterium]|jgi:2-amino-4-hydroxy-6-hydroxymethyldihydropteridine diphosphokinase/dihydropteroate synthase|nr:dihydropteroate synthase [Holosporaceae bacterium]
MVYLSLGSNVGNRFENIRTAIAELSAFFDCKTMSHLIETEAILPDGAPPDWNKPYLNVVVVGDSGCSPFELLSHIKKIEQKIGRNMDAPRWSPRVVDIDILSYYGQMINSKKITLPHQAIGERKFLQYLLWEVGYFFPENVINGLNYVPLDHFVLNPKMVGIVNVTPDSFSDGGKYFDPAKAEAHARKIYADGAYVVEFGPQSTKPGYKEVSPKEEIARLSEVFERCSDINCKGVDTYFADVARYAIENHKVKWINDQKGALNAATIRLIADNDVKLVTMLQGTDMSAISERIKILRHGGMSLGNIIIDPGIGFGKTKYQNIKIIQNCRTLRDFGCEVLMGHSRKSFMELFTNFPAPERDVETLAISDFMSNSGVDYIRIHNVRDHMRFLVAKNIVHLMDPAKQVYF